MLRGVVDVPGCVGSSCRAAVGYSEFASRNVDAASALVIDSGFMAVAFRMGAEE